MGKHFFDWNKGDIVFSISDKTAMDSKGDLLLRISDRTAMDLDSGELHITSGWDTDED